MNNSGFKQYQKVNKMKSKMGWANIILNTKRKYKPTIQLNHKCCICGKIEYEMINMGNLYFCQSDCYEKTFKTDNPIEEEIYRQLINAQREI